MLVDSKCFIADIMSKLEKKATMQDMDWRLADLSSFAWSEYAG